MKNLLLVTMLACTTAVAVPAAQNKLQCGRTHHLQTRGGQDFDSIIRNNKLVVVDFYADWCGPCKRFGPIFDQVAGKFNDVVFLKVNVDQHSELSTRYGIKGIPAVIVFKDGKKAGQSGAKSAPEFEQYVQQYRK